MKAISILWVTLLATSTLIAQDSWMKKADFGGGKRQGLFYFSIGNKGFAGTGVDESGIVKSDFWEYDPATNAWMQKADFGGGIRFYGTGFSIKDKGYAGAGIVGSYNWRKDMWEYDTASNSWKQIADFGGGLRYVAVGFSIGSKGYMGTGSYRENSSVPATYYNDFWEYDSQTDIWRRKADVPQQGRNVAVGISIGNKGYIGTGLYYYDTRVNDWWEYDPSTDKWTQKASLPATQRYAAGAFTIGNRGFIASGWYYSGITDLWEYDPGNDQWIQRNYSPLPPMYGPVCFGIGNKGYVGMGAINGYGVADFWQYTPACSITANIPDVYAVKPGGNVNTIYIGYGPGSLTLTASVQGEPVSYHWSNGSADSSIVVSPSIAGTYTYSVVVTDKLGCSATAHKTITVVDVRCGKDKVSVCHVPPGNPANMKTLCISTDAVPINLSNGSYLGTCTSSQSNSRIAAEHNQLSLEKTISVTPNPTNGRFLLQLNNCNAKKASLKVMNVNGNTVLTKTLTNTGNGFSEIVDLRNVTKGFYIVQVTTIAGSYVTNVFLK